MRFVCDSCRAQYMISDDKVGAKGVKVRCKKCGYVILVRRPDAADVEGPTSVGPSPLGGADGLSEPTAPGADSPLSDEPLTHPGVAASSFGSPSGGEGMLGDLEDDEIGAVFDQVLRSGPQKIPADQNGSLTNGSMALSGGEDDLASTRVVSLDALQKLAFEAEAKERNGDANGNGHADERAKSNVPLTDWFVAVDDQQVGPLTLEQLKEKWDRGEVGAESLCWRAGFSDWTALSEVAALASILAPRPTKPVIVAPASVGSGVQGSMVSVPVESAFNAGGMSQTVRTEVSMMAGEPGPAESGGWKPSAASALASLAMQEVESFSRKPAAKPSAPEPSSSRGLLDLPAENSTNARANGSSGAHGGTQDSDPRHRIQEGFSSASAPFPQPSYDTYRPPTQPPPPDKTSRNFAAVIAVVILLLLLLGGAVVYLLTHQNQTGSTTGQIAVVPPPVVNPATTIASTTTPPAGTTPPNGVVAGNQGVAGSVPSGAVVATTPPAGTTVPPGKTVAALTPTPKTSDLPPAPTIKSDVGEERTPTTHRRGPRRTAEAREPSGPSGGGGEEITAGPANPSAKKDDDEFASVFGKKGGTSEEAPKKKSAPSQYIPPAPGQGADVPNDLSQGDIMGVVVGNKPAIVGCVNEQKKKDPGVTGTLVMRWTITTAGRATGVIVRTDEFKSSSMASCMTGLIKSWSFPKHKVQGQPIDFPFKF